MSAGGAGKDVESGLGESFTSAASKLDGDAAASPFLLEPAPEEVRCSFRAILQCSHD